MLVILFLHFANDISQHTHTHIHTYINASVYKHGRFSSKELGVCQACTDVGCVLSHATEGRKRQPVAKARRTRATSMQRHLRGDQVAVVAFSCWPRVDRVSRKRATRAKIYCRQKKPCLQNFIKTVSKK